jgi:hypothetical protein
VGQMDKPTIKRCHGWCAKGKHICKEDYKILEHTIDFIFRSPKW